MITELQEFYSHKAIKFSETVRSCVRVCDVIHYLYDNLLYSLFAIYGHAESINIDASDDTKYWVNEFIHRLKYKVQLLEQELGDIDIIIGMSCHHVCPNMRLIDYKHTSSTSEVNTIALDLPLILTRCIAYKNVSSIYLFDYT